MEILISYRYDSGEHGFCFPTGEEASVGFDDPTPYIGKVDLSELLNLFEEFGIEPVFGDGIRWQGTLHGVHYEVVLYGVTRASQMRIARYLKRVDYAGDLNQGDLEKFIEWYCNKTWTHDPLRGNAMVALFNLTTLANSTRVALYNALQIITALFGQEFTIWQIFRRDIGGTDE